MFDFSVNTVQSAVYALSIISMLFVMVVEIGKFFCVQPFYNFTKSNFYTHHYTLIFGAIMFVSFVTGTIGIFTNNIDMINFGTFIVMFATILFVLFAIVWYTMKLVFFISDYHKKLANKRFGEDK